MAAFEKSYGIALAIIAFALTVTGVVLAATDSNPSGIAKDSLALGGVPPHTASLLVTVTNGQSYDVTATINVNFDTSRAEAIVQFPLLFTQTSLELRLIGDHVYAGAADVSSGKWLAINFKAPSFFGLALEMTQPAPDLHLVNGFRHERTTKSGYSTTFDFSSDSVALTNVLHSPRTTVLGSLKVTVTTGASGEVTGATMMARSRHDISEITVQVLSYNERTVITAPSSGDISSRTIASFHQLFSTSFATLLLPANFSALLSGTAQVS